MAPPAGAALPAAALYGQGRDRRPRCCPERGAHPGPPRASLGHLTCASAGAAAPGAEGISPEFGGQARGAAPRRGSPGRGVLSRPFSRSLTSGRRSPCAGAAPTAVPVLCTPPRRDRRDPPVIPPRPGTPRRPPRYLAGRRAGSRRRRGGAGRAASPPCWADPRWLRRRHRGGAGAGRRPGRGGRHVVQPRPRRSGEGAAAGPTLPALYPTCPCRTAHSRSSPDSVRGTLGSVRTAPSITSWSPGLWAMAGHPWYSPTPALAPSERSLLVRTGHPQSCLSVFWESLAQVCTTSSPHRQVQVTPDQDLTASPPNLLLAPLVGLTSHFCPMQGWKQQMSPI